MKPEIHPEYNAVNVTCSCGNTFQTGSTYGKDELSIEVEAVIDGDTLKLTSGEFVRLIGIDAPEIGHNGKASQPHAQEAKKYLLSLVKSADGL
ncbi:unnamed protein product, partial [Cyprideis torosa]